MILDKHLGVVITNDKDPEKNFGITCQVDTLLPGRVYPEIFYPIFPPNMVKAPDVKQIVEVFVLADEIGEPGEAELGTVSNSDYCFYTGRIFDTKDGKIPNDLKTNYPKRSGIFWASDSTIIYYDETKNQKELVISLTDKKVLARLTENEIVIQKNLTKITLKDNQITAENGTAIIDLTGGTLAVTNAITALGTPSATQSILLGTIVIAAFNAFFTSWLSAVSAAENDPSGIQDPVIETYIKALGSVGNIIATIQGTTTNWPSVKHKVDV